MRPVREFLIQDRKIGHDYPTYFIADVAANHDGDLGRAKDLIFRAAESGANAAKFQHFTADTIVSDKGFKELGGQSSHQASWKKSVFDVYKEASINRSWTAELKKTCDQAGIHFFTSPYSLELVDEVNPFVPAFKVGSGDITWLEIIQYMASKNKPMLLATGASRFDEVVKAVDTTLSLTGNVCLMQCNTNYTASLENLKYINLNVLKTYRKMFPDLVLGLSDHTPGHATVLGSIALGARVIEKHFTDSNGREGPDHKFSMNPIDWREMVDRSRELEFALGTGIKKVEENEKETVLLQRRSIRLNRDMKQGESISKGDLNVLRPCPEGGLPPYELDNVVGRILNNDLEEGDHLTWNKIN